MARNIEDFEAVGPVFPSHYKGTCALDWDHRIKMGDKVCRIQRRDNPMIPVGGVACSKCIKILPRGER